MTEIIDLSKCKLNERAGTYGGKAGFKDAIVYNNEYWIVKYPQSTKGFRVRDVSYTTAPLSEYIGSQVYQKLGYDTHDTILGCRNNKIVVACKDFCKKEGALREIRTLKNLANEKLEEKLNQSFNSTGSSHFVDLEETLLHIKYNDILSKVPGIEKRFWDMVVVDALINNNDRNNSNWGVLYEDGVYKLAPVYDNGAAFSNKVSDEKLLKQLQNKDIMLQSINSATTAYSLKDKQIFTKDLFQLEYNGFKESVLRNVPLFVDKKEEIIKMIKEIPESYNGKYICSDVRKEAYIQNMDMRMEYYFLPAYEKYMKEQNMECTKNNEKSIGKMEKSKYQEQPGLIKAAYEYTIEKLKDVLPDDETDNI